MVDEPLPPEFQFGKVVGRVIRAVADTAEDVDALPQARPAAGTVTFTPRQSLRVITTPGDKTFVTAAAETVNLSAAGRIIDAEGRQGVWLVTGTYDVRFDLTGGMGLPSMVIEVTTDHTDDAPLDLVDDASYVPPPRTPVQTLLVPVGGTDGYVLTRSGTELAWTPPPSTTPAPDATTSTKGIVQLAGDLGGTAAAPTVPGLATRPDTTAVQAAIDAAIADLVAGAPDALNTLNELATQLGSDETAAGALITLVTAIRTLTDTTHVTALSNAYARLSGVQATRTTDGAAIAGQHNPVDATSGNRTVTLADASGQGQLVAVSKKDATTNTVTVSVAHLRDGGAGSIVLVGQYEAITLTAKADGSWWPVGDHKTKVYLDAAYKAPTDNLRSLSDPIFRTGLDAAYALTSYASQVATLSDYPASFPSVNEVETVVYSGSVGATRPAADFVVWQGFPTQPTNMLDGDLWLSDLGGTFIISTVAPTSADGADGDGWLNKTTWLFYGPKASGAWPAGQSIKGADGTNGRGITSIARTSGTGAAGTTDTYTITYSDSTTSTFNVTNGANGSGGGAVVEPTTAPPSTNTTGSVLGTSVNAAHADHTHAVGAHDHTTTAKGGTLPVGALSATGTPSSSTYLRGDNTWGTPAGGGTSAAPNINRPLAQPTGTISATLDRFSTQVTATTVTSGVVYLAPMMLTSGDSLTAFRLRIGSPSAVTHTWLALADSSRVVVAVTADDTTASPTNNGGTSEYRQYAISSGPYAVTTTGLYYLAFCMVATTASIVVANNLGASIVGTVQPGFGAAATAQTTPPSVGATLTAATGGAGFIPWVWAV